MIDKDILATLQQKICSEPGEQSFNAFYKLCFPALNRFTFSFVKNKEISEEIVSDIMLKIWQRRKELSKIKNLKLYLYVSARNHAFNHLRLSKSRETEDIENVAVWLKADDQFSPEQKLINDQQLTRIYKAIKQLPPKCQLIYKLVKEDGFRYQEVADLLKLSPKTIEAQMAIAVKKLYAALITPKNLY
ncbi:MAG TPA: RNA polymerase sigma-70 factor [Niabella sp.]